MKMGEGKEALSHEEVWDDSALIDSWNQALDEYKKYHSIHAKGGSLKDLEHATGSRTTELAAPQKPEDTTAENRAACPEQTPPSRTSQGPSLVPPGPPPQAVLGTMQDENLKKLLMSWYYAGYYTGLFEGQRQAMKEEQLSETQR